VCAGGERLPLKQQLASLMATTEEASPGDIVFKSAVDAAIALTLYFREYCTMLGQEVRYWKSAQGAPAPLKILSNILRFDDTSL
jgi:hypothetical protein